MELPTSRQVVGRFASIEARMSNQLLPTCC